MVIAHRGFSARAPENTLTAIRWSMEAGADMVEVDVTQTVDGQLIVLHDETLDRTTNGQGSPQEKTLAEIRALDAGAWFHRRFVGERVPTLAEVLDLVKDRLLINLEIKPEAVTETLCGGIMEKIVSEVRDRDMAGQVQISSFAPRALLHLRELAPELPAASLFNRQLHRGLLPSQIAAPVSASAFNINQFYLRKAMLKDAQAHGLPVAVFTVNRTWRMRRLLSQGVHAMFTDRPDRMIRLLENL